MRAERPLAKAAPAARQGESGGTQAVYQRVHENFQAAFYAKSLWFSDFRRSARRCLPAILLIAASPLPAEEPASPDAGFLEYLGMWDGQDEDWELFEEEPAEVADLNDDKRIDPAPEGDASTETDDEG